MVLESILHLIQALGEVTKGDSIYTGNLPLVKIFSSPEIVRSHLARNRKLLQLFWILLLKKKGPGYFFFSGHHPAFSSPNFILWTTGLRGGEVNYNTHE